MQNNEWKVILDHCQQLVPLTSRITLFWQLCKDDYTIVGCKVTYNFKAFNSINCIHNETFSLLYLSFLHFFIVPLGISSGVGTRRPYLYIQLHISFCTNVLYLIQSSQPNTFKAPFASLTISNL